MFLIHAGSFLSTSVIIYFPPKIDFINAASKLAGFLHMRLRFGCQYLLILKSVETFYIRVHIKFELHLFGWHWHNEFCLQELKRGTWVYVSQLYLPLIKRNTCFFYMYCFIFMTQTMARFEVIFRNLNEFIRSLSSYLKCYFFFLFCKQTKGKNNLEIRLSMISIKNSWTQSYTVLNELNYYFVSLFYKRFFY